jgi:hypothetical protein
MRFTVPRLVALMLKAALSMLSISYYKEAIYKFVRRLAGFIVDVKNMFGIFRYILYIL